MKQQEQRLPALRQLEEQRGVQQPEVLQPEVLQQLVALRQPEEQQVLQQPAVLLVLGEPELLEEQQVLLPLAQQVQLNPNLNR
jgi:hypothetical protein